MMITIQLILASGVMLAGSIAEASVTIYEGDAEAWKAAVGHNFTTIDFTGATNFAPIADDYAHLGVTFSSNAHYWLSGAFVNDNWGMEAVDGAWLTFDTPQHWIAADHPGFLWFDLYLEGELVYTSPMLGGSGGGKFSGLIASDPFDMVFLYKNPPLVNVIAIDDLHFGTFIPGPGALGLLALAGFATRRRRRA